MKSKLLLFLFVAFSTGNQAQSSKDKTVYLDSLWRETSEGNHQFYRIIKDYYADTETYKIFDYYKTGILQMEGLSSSKNEIVSEGEIIFYYENGNKKSINNYIKNHLTGKEIQFYENGNKKLEGEYIDDSKNSSNPFKINQFWKEKGEQKILNGNGDFEEISKNYFAKGKLKNGYKEGLWEGYDIYLKYTFTESYSEGKLIFGTSLDSNKMSHNYNEIEIKPEPKNGYADFYKYVGKKFRISTIPKSKGGKIYITFYVDHDGKIIEPAILKGIGYDADEEAIRVITNADKWIPGQVRGINVKCQFSLPIAIRPI